VWVALPLLFSGGWRGVRPVVTAVRTIHQNAVEIMHKKRTIYLFPAADGA
jgi:hypothetical protein